MFIERTVIGSFPRQLDSDSLIKNIRKVVDLQLAYNIDIITDGEQRGDMIEYFEQIPGLGKTDGSLKIVGKIRPMDNPDNFHKFIDYNMVKSYLAGLNREAVKVKITLTGPITLGFTCAFGGIRYYRNYRDERLYSDLSEALIPLAEKSLDIGCHLQIDEPGVSGRYVSPKFARKFLYKFFKSLPSLAIDEGRVSMHMCGAISRSLYNEVLDLDVGILSFAFSGEREKINKDIVSRKTLEENQKRLGVGFISNTKVEEEKIALSRLTNIAEIVGSENIATIHPDCGFGNTPPEIVEPILENMKKASDKFMLSLQI